LKNPREAQEWCKRALANPGIARAAVRRAAPDAPSQNLVLALHNLLVITCVDAGELTKARSHLAEVDAVHKPTKLLLVEGEWELAGKLAIADFERSRTMGNRKGESEVVELARAHRFTGELARAMPVLQRALDISVDGADILLELITRSLLATLAGLATMAGDTGDAAEALPHLERCRQIVGGGENWFGLAGVVERAEAVVAAAQGENAAAERHFEKAIATFQRYCLPWEEADTLQYWGQALVGACERARAIEKFEAAIEIYRSRGASSRFFDYVMADKMRAQCSRSTHT
jgi:tetratricopeptide (TPR) repeat protein